MPPTAPEISVRFNAMLYSPASKIAFAHYPKNAGCTMFQWFTTAFPDSLHLDPDGPHLGVRPGLERLARRDRSGPLGRLRGLLGRSAGLAAAGRQVRILGVVRDPFESLVSLYEFWRRGRPGVFGSELMRAAKEGSFAEFLDLAIRERQCPRYVDFFDVGGPAWKNTRLLDFAALEPALAQACREFGIDPPRGLERLNAAPARLKSIEEYRREVGSFIILVRNYFRWYHEHGVKIMLRG